MDIHHPSFLHLPACTPVAMLQPCIVQPCTTQPLSAPLVCFPCVPGCVSPFIGCLTLEVDSMYMAAYMLEQGDGVPKVWGGQQGRSRRGRHTRG